jgi:hypothetical protein
MPPFRCSATAARPVVLFPISSVRICLGEYATFVAHAKVDAGHLNTLMSAASPTTQVSFGPERMMLIAPHCFIRHQ